MRKRYKLLLLFSVLLLAAIFVGLNLEPVKAATRKIVYNLRFNDGLVSYWSFDGAYLSGATATDRSGNGNSGTLNAGPSIIEGVVGQALTLDGADDYISTANSFSNPQNFSVSFWFKTATASGHKIIGFETSQTGTGSASYDRQIYIGTDGKIYFGWYSGSFNLITSTNALNDDKWHYVVGTHASGGGGVLYVDGVSQGTAANDAESYVGYWRIGSYKLTSWTNASDGYYAGQIDEVRIYNRSLSAAEQAYVYARTKPAGIGTMAKFVANDIGLVGFWNFDDCDTCATVADRSENGNTGTMYKEAGPTEGDLHTASGRIGRGANFDGSNDYVDVGISATLASSQFTTSAWVYFNEADASTIIDAGYSFPSKGYLIRRNVAGYIDFWVDSGSESGVVTTSAPTGVWQHVVAVYDGTNASIYWNGTLQQTSAMSYVTNPGVNVYIGKAGGAGTYMNGKIDEVHMYNRALSSAEIKNLYASTQKSFVNMPQNNFIKDGLVGNWSFNGQDMSGVTAIDRGAGGNNGTLTGGPVVTEGIVGQALSFDGVNDYVTIGDNATLDIASAITISTWIKHTSNTFKDWEAIVTKGDSAYRLHLCGNTSFCGGTPLDDAINATFTGTSCSNNSVTSTVVPALNKWYHVVTTYEGSAIKIYIDGALNAEVGCTGSITTNGFALNVGENSESAGRQWTGDIDEVRLYNRALNATEILKLYNAGKR